MMTSTGILVSPQPVRQGRTMPLWQICDGDGLLLVLARAWTKSEARALLKQSMGKPFPAGFVVTRRKES